ncbi:hypothetical protein PCAR4_830093 [Paraburkholderia caribensis]|nr:hypothetical protein PCAR4_830093 [Paraburkholderia caribensis]
MLTEWCRGLRDNHHARDLAGVRLNRRNIGRHFKLSQVMWPTHGRTRLDTGTAMSF